ncbi:MAG: oxidoreductase, partial [Bacteroidetes bacterium]|nr:oxidoreductase [Bacteroidota bacterium]
MKKPKIALYWCSSCGGCEESVIDIAEVLLDIADGVEIVFWPIALDFKYDDIEKMPDGEIYLSVINGSIRMDEHERISRLLRRKSRFIAAHGSCAHIGGIFGLANLYDTPDIFKRIYLDCSSVNNPDEILPGADRAAYGEKYDLPKFLDAVKPLNDIVSVDYYLPGCPPTPEIIKNGIMAIFANERPPNGTVLSEKKALCDSCPRRDSKPEKINVE